MTDYIIQFQQPTLIWHFLYIPNFKQRAGAHNLLKYRKVTRPGIEPRTFWTYTRCSNQLSYLVLEFNQLILYLCNCQPKDTRSLHSPPFSRRTPLGLRRTRPIQNANFLALELLEFSGDFLVIFRCRSAGLVSPTDFPMDCPPEYHQTSTESPPEMTGQHQKVRRKSTGLQQTPSRQSSLLVLLIK